MDIGGVRLGCRGINGRIAGQHAGIGRCRGLGIQGRLGSCRGMVGLFVHRNVHVVLYGVYSIGVGLVGSVEGRVKLKPA